MKRFIILLVALILASCSTERHLARVGHSPNFKIGMYTPVHHYKVLQVHDRNFCLAVDDAIVDPSVIAITMSNDIEPVYEGQKLKGLYVMIDTYTYETKSNDLKTVPLVTPIRDFEEMQYTEKLLEKAEKKHKSNKNENIQRP